MSSSLRTILNIKGTDAINGLKERQLSELLYRDDLVLKHSASPHIQATVKQLTDEATNEKKDRGVITAIEGPEATLVSALVEFLLEAHAMFSSL